MSKEKPKKPENTGNKLTFKNTCPACGHTSGDDAVVIGIVSHIDGIETRRIKCERCEQVHFVKRYT